MPQFTYEFLKLDTKYKYSLPPINYANFLLEYLAGLFVTIDDKSSTKYKTMAKLLITYFTSSIMKQERLYGKAESVFSKKQRDNNQDEDDVTVSELSGEGFGNYKTDQSAAEFSDLDKEVDYNADEIQSFGDAYDVEDAKDVWDID